MTKMLWPYKNDDKSTWKYIDCEIGGEKQKRFIKEWILNPDFAYKHLDPHYPLITEKKYKFIPTGVKRNE